MPSEPSDPTPRGPARLAVRDVHLSFGETSVLRGINLDLASGSLAVIGPSGGGKSTLLRVLAGLIPPDEGQVIFDGRPVDFSEPAVRAHRRRIGFVFQSRGLFDHLTSVQNITLPLVHVHGMTEDAARERARGLLARFGLSEAEDRRPHQLSGGQQQRVAIARAVAIDPDWLMLDEPTSALDPEYTSEVLDMLRTLQADGMRLIVVTHVMGFARHSCDRVAFLDEGLIRAIGPAETFFSRPGDPSLASFLAKVLEWNV